MIERYQDLFVNRADVYARQSPDGEDYWCIRQPVTPAVIAAHVEGKHTCGWYGLNQAQQVRWAVVDLDHDAGIATAQTLSARLAELDIPSYIEASREGRAHLWLFTAPWPAKPIRILLRGVVEDKPVEIYPKQDRLSSGGVGSLVRGPLGIHRKTGERYPFLDPATLERVDDNEWYLHQIQRAEGDQLASALTELLQEQPRTPQARSRRERVSYAQSAGDALAVAQALNIALDDRGHYQQGLCPFHPHEQHPSFTIYPNTNIWICWHGPKVGCGGVSLVAAVRGISLAEAEERLKEGL
jgi:hypothetical protein